MRQQKQVAPQTKKTDERMFPCNSEVSDGGKKEEWSEPAQTYSIFADHVGSDNRDNRVPKPVGRGREADAAGTDGKGENFADQNPRCSCGGGESVNRAILGGQMRRDSPPGPQVLAKKKIEMAIKATCALTAATLRAKVSPAALT